LQKKKEVFFLKKEAKTFSMFSFSKISSGVRNILRVAGMSLR